MKALGKRGLLVALCVALTGVSLHCGDARPNRRGRGLSGTDLVADGGFEQTADGSFPPGWSIAERGAARAFVTRDHPLDGTGSLRVELLENCFPPAAPAVLSYLIVARRMPRYVRLRARSSGSAEAMIGIEMTTPLGPQAEWERFDGSFYGLVRLPGAQSAALVLRIFGPKGAFLTVDDISIEPVR